MSVKGKIPNVVQHITENRGKDYAGGTDCVIIGLPGCGKTSALAQLALLNWKKHKDIVIWRNSSDCQFSFFRNFPEHVPLRLWLRNEVSMNIIDRKKGTSPMLMDVFDDVKGWHNVHELVRKIDNNYINIVQTSPYSATDSNKHLLFAHDWIKIIEELNVRMNPNNVSIYFDEIEDMVPDGAAGRGFYDVEMSMSSMIRKNRKNDISLYMAAHYFMDIHWRIAKKIRYRIYMKGASIPKGSKVISATRLSPGAAFIEGGGLYQPFSFEYLGEEHKLRATLEVTDADYANLVKAYYSRRALKHSTKAIKNFLK